MVSSSSPDKGILASGRRTDSFIRTFELYTESIYAPLIFRRWAAISLVSAVLERKVWVHTRGSDFFPNLYVLLVGPPSAGKGLVLKEVNKLLSTLTNPSGTPSTTHLHVAPTSLTTSSLIDELKDSERKIVSTGVYLAFHSLQIVIPEFSDFAPMYDPRFMSALQSLYDGTDVPFSERRRTKDHNVKIHNPQLGLIAGTTPSYINSFMPEGAWDQGFISRTIMVFSNEEQAPDIFRVDPERPKLFEALKHELKTIFAVTGKLDWTDDGKAAMNAWVNSYQQPVPAHRKLSSYNGRRLGQVVKLATVAAVDRNRTEIDAESFQIALGWLLEAETVMSDIFKYASSAGDSQALEDCWFFAMKEFGITKLPIPEMNLVRFLQDRVPSHAVMRIIELLEKSALIKKVDAGGPAGSWRYQPLPRV